MSKRKLKYYWKNALRIIEEREETICKLDSLYHELIMSVAQKFPNETRHETALRYIEERESNTHEHQQNKEQP